MKTNEELNALKEEIEALNRKLAELNEDEMKQVTGGAMMLTVFCPKCQNVISVDIMDPSPRCPKCGTIIHLEG